MNKTAIKQVAEINEIRQMQRFLVRAFPSARITLDEPLVAGGVWSLDLLLPDYHLAVAWHKNKGFGIVADETHGYGEGADEVYDDLETVLPRIVELISNKRPTTAPEAIKLKDLREQRGLSQEEVARRLGKKQASISRTEARSDFLVSTLQEIAQGLGGRLVVKVVFSDSERELKLGGKVDLEAI
jgi:DNA-binding XRE family transcriptional regulator